MNFEKLQQTTQYRINQLTLVTEYGDFDLTPVFEELNLYDNLLMPCMSGNLLIRDASNFIENLRIDGSRYLMVDIDKGAENSMAYSFKKKFWIYKVANTKNANYNSKIYSLHFVSPEHQKSEQLKLTRSYTGGKYSDYVQTILTDSLNVPFASPTNGNSGIASIMPSSGAIDIAVPTLTPLDSIEWITKRSLNGKYLPDFVFYETQFGYNFLSLDTIYNFDPVNTISVTPKNYDDNLIGEMLGARDFKVVSTYQSAENITNGAYAGTFFGFDTLTRTKDITQINYKTDVFDRMNHPNKNPILPPSTVESFTKQYDSRIVVYPYATPRTTNAYVKENNPSLSGKINKTEDYVFQRKTILYSLMQRRIKVVLAGNFSLFSGQMINMNVPNFSSKKENQSLDDALDKDLTGKYLIVGTRHIIRYDRHETMIEIATDSTNK